MKSVFHIVVSLGLAAGIIASAALAQSPSVSAPTTTAEFEELLGIAVKAAEEVAAAEKERTQLKADVTDHVKKVREHNASLCAFPTGHAEDCRHYDLKKKALDERQKELLGKVRLNDGRRGTAKTHFSISMARFRIESVLSELEPWRRRIVACANLLNPIAAAACLKREWERIPPIRRKPASG